MTIANSILVYAEDGVVKHRFCTEADARATIDQFSNTGDGGSMFACDGIEAEIILSISPDLRNRVEAAKAKLRSDLKIKQALDEHGVPEDRELRVCVFNAIKQLRGEWLLVA